MNYFPFHIGDYAAHTRHLSLMEDLAYRRMLDVYYTTEGPLPAEVERVARLINMREHVADAQVVLDEFFELTEDGWRHARCDAEIQKYQAVATRNRANGAKGGRPVSTTTETQWVSSGLPDETQVVARNNPPVTLPRTNTKNQEPNTPLPPAGGSARRAPPEPDPMFTEFWQAYPRKIGKPIALKAWRTARVDGAMHAAMLEAIQRHKASPQWTKDGGEFIPHPSTWINQRRWEDESVNGSRPTYQQPEWMRHAK